MRLSPHNMGAYSLGTREYNYGYHGYSHHPYQDSDVESRQSLSSRKRSRLAASDADSDVRTRSLQVDIILDIRRRTVEVNNIVDIRRRTIELNISADFRLAIVRPKRHRLDRRFSAIHWIPVWKTSRQTPPVQSPRAGLLFHFAVEAM